MSLELELVPICLVSDTDIEATVNQRWTSEGPFAEGPFANPHVFRGGDCITMVLPSVQQSGSHEYLDRMSAR